MYEIANYDGLYRPYDKSGNELKHADWVKVPAKPKGDGLQELLEHRRGLEVFAIWILLLEKTTTEKKAENRGKLLNRKELEATIPEIASGISLKKRIKLVEYAISVLISMGWINTEQTSAPLPQSSPNYIKEKSIKLKSNTTVIFEQWNSFKGNKKWKSHTKLSYEIEQAITEQLKHYSVIDLCGAIENYAKVLLSSDFKWSYAWTLQQFLTRSSPHNRNEKQLWRFLPNNYHDEDYLTDSAKGRRTKQRKEFYEFFRDCEEQKLIAAYRENKNNLNWLCDEIRPEIAGKAKQ